MTELDPFTMQFGDLDAETAIYMALGAASVCYEDGVFMSERAERIGTELIEHLRKLRLLPVEPNFLGVTIEDMLLTPEYKLVRPVDEPYRMTRDDALACHNKGQGVLQRLTTEWVTFNPEGGEPR